MHCSAISQTQRPILARALGSGWAVTCRRRRLPQLRQLFPNSTDPRLAPAPRPAPSGNAGSPVGGGMGGQPPPPTRPSWTALTSQPRRHTAPRPRRHVAHRRAARRQPAGPALLRAGRLLPEMAPRWPNPMSPPPHRVVAKPGKVQPWAVLSDLSCWNVHSGAPGRLSPWVALAGLSADNIRGGGGE